MTKNYKILGNYIKDMSSETPNIETYIFVKESNFKISINN
jgi:preprotein translocase subunit SecB